NVGQVWANGGATIPDAEPTPECHRPGQIAAVLPAATTIGSATLTVTYNGVASNAFAFAVVPTALGINTYFTNSGVATDAVSYAVITYNNSGAPGQTIIDKVKLHLAQAIEESGAMVTSGDLPSVWGQDA